MKLKRPQLERTRRPKAAEVLAMPEEPEMEIPFDPDRFFTHEDWASIKQEATRYHNDFKSEMYSYVALVGPALMMSPQHTELILWTDTEKNQWIHQLKRGQYDTSPTQMFYYAKTTLAIDPALRSDLDQLFPVPRSWQSFEGQVRGLVAQKRFGEIPGFILLGCQFFPDQCQGRLVDDAMWELLTQKLNELRKPSLWGPRDPMEFPSFATQLMLLSHDNPSRVQLTREDWEQLNDNLAHARQERRGWIYILSLASHMAILASERSFIGPDGQIKLTKKPKPLAGRRPLPERPHV